MQKTYFVIGSNHFPSVRFRPSCTALRANVEPHTQNMVIPARSAPRFQKIGGKVLQPYGISVSQILGIVQNMEQFPDISRPGIALEEFHYLIVQGSGAVDILIGSSRQVVLDQFIQILHVHAERRKLDHNSRETVEEILPELIVCDTLEGVFVAGRDDTDIHGNILLPSNPAKRVFLKSPEDLRLHGKTHGIQLI